MMIAVVALIIAAPSPNSREQMKIVTHNLIKNCM